MKSWSRILLIFCLTWILSRSLIYLLPGDSAEFLIHESLVNIKVQDLRQEMHLDASPLKRIFTLPGGASFIRKEKSAALVSRALFKSSVLAVISLFFTITATTASLYFQFVSFRFRQFANLASQAVSTIPLFVMGPMLLLFVCVWMKILPPVRSPLLPAIALSIYLSAHWYRILRSQIADYLPRSSVTGARARGLNEFSVFWKHAAAPIAKNFAGFFGSQVGWILNGSLLVEVIFQWRGIGSLLADSVLARDYPVIELSLICVSLMSLLAQQAGDLLAELRP